MKYSFRVFAVILLFTPSLGLFDTFHHGRLAAINVRDGDRAFDTFGNGNPITFQEAWEPFRLDDAANFLFVSLTVTIWILFSTIVLHILAISCTSKIMIGTRSMSMAISQGFHSILNPPLHIDWEMFYRQDSTKDVLKCWRRWKK